MSAIFCLMDLSSFYYSILSKKSSWGRVLWIFNVTDINLKLKSAFIEMNIHIRHHKGGQGSLEPSELNLKELNLLLNLKV